MYLMIKVIYDGSIVHAVTIITMTTVEILSLLGGYLLKE